MDDVARIDYQILGPMKVVTAAGAVDVGGPKQRAVLAVLLINANRPITAGQMIDALWGDRPPATATATLQSYVSNLRRALEPNRPRRTEARILQTNGGGYQLAVDPQQVDAMRFEQSVIEASSLLEVAPDHCRELLGGALDLWRGPALADFRYDDFARNEIMRLDEMRVTALELRVAADLAIGSSAELVGELEELVASYPLRERLWRHLMLALYRTGRQAEALRAYRRFEEIAGEMGISPNEDLRRLELDILNQSPTLALRRSTGAPQASRLVEIVGRARERARFRSALDRAVAGRGSVLLYEGEAGVGKTRLLEVFDADATAHGFTSAFARCVEVGGTPPFWPWAQLARQLGVERLEEAAGRFVTRLAPLLPHADTDLTGHGAPLHRVAEALAVALGVIAAGTPLLLVIDDLDGADPDSLAILTLLAAELGSLPIVIVTSHRGRGKAPDSALDPTVTELMRLEWVDRFAVPRLDVSEVSELVERLADQEIDEGTLRAIFRRTEGNAFYTIELTKLLLATSSLSHREASTAVPATVLEVMERRLRRLSPPTLKLIRVGAVCGRRFDLAVASRAAELEFVDAVAAAEEAVRAGLLLEGSRPGTYRFSHMIVVDSVTQALGAMRRGQLHHLVAEALEDRFGADPARWVEIAHHRSEAAAFAGAHQAIAALAKAGAFAMRSNAVHLAEELFVKRYDLALSEPPSPQRDNDEIAALFDLAKVWTWKEGYHSSHLRRSAARLWELTGISTETIRFDSSRPITSSDPVLSSLQARFSVEIVSGDIPAAEEVAERLLTLSEEYPDPMVVFAANQTATTVWVHAGRVRPAVAAVGRAEASLEILDPRRTNALMLPLGQQPARITHHSFAAWAHFLAGDADRVTAELDASRRLCAELLNPFVTSFCVTVEGLIGAMARSPQTTAAALEWGLAHGRGPLFGLVETWWQLQAVWSEGMLGGDPVAASGKMRSGLDGLQRHGAQIATSLYWAMVAELELSAGRHCEALDAIRHGVTRARTSGERFWYPELERLNAVALEAVGRGDEGRKARRRAHKWAQRLGVVPVQRRLAAAEGDTRLLVAD